MQQSFGSLINQLLASVTIVFLSSCAHSALSIPDSNKTNVYTFEVTQNINMLELERPRILAKAQKYLLQQPKTVTNDIAVRSVGNKHEFYSEGDYWWPNPEDPTGPYIRRDGETNPDNFIAHRQSMILLSDIIGTLASAYIITSDPIYVKHAEQHLHAWFVNPDTQMAPHLKYAQAIKGRNTGRSIGIIDTLHLVEVAKGAKVLVSSKHFNKSTSTGVKSWFKTYLHWINTHPFGITERDWPNNHGVCWSLQAAAFADLVGDKSQIKWVQERFINVYLTQMMDQTGGFPAELKRTKPYGYSLFVLDAMAGIAQIASNESMNLWTYETEDGRGMALAMKFIAPYIKDKSSWPLKPDVLYWEEWPVRHPSLIFAAQQYNNQNYFALWHPLEADPTTYEVLRNLPIRHPLLWL